MPVLEKNREVELLLQLRAEFDEGWKLSTKGNENIWRRWDGMMLSVFKRRDEKWSWCYSDDESSRFSRTAFDTLDDAKCALWDALY